ncbi:MAG: 3-dehydroquinate synthase, partial [Campylobacterota bacterium]|nr:3-dehydroquinate synthase [Campylobacterota bacterium]
EFFEWLESNDLNSSENLNYAIQKSAETKAWVVAQDEKEKGLRAALNYGHTFCHVIENETAYSKYLHGEAVAIGMCMANDVACNLGWMSSDESKRVAALLEKYGLPVTYDIKNINSFYEAFFLDKKSNDTTLTFIIPKGLGGVEISNTLDEELIKKTLTKYRE